MNYPGDYDVVNPLWQRGMAYGVEQERARIISLLETMNCHRDTAIQCDCGSYWEAIALIKGENE